MPLPFHRLKGYDDTHPGADFLAICTWGRESVLDDPVVTGIVTDVWHALPGWFPTIALNEFVVMSNHVHFIVWIHLPDDVGATLAVAQDRAGASPAPTEEETRDVGGPLGANRPFRPGGRTSLTTQLADTWIAATWLTRGAILKAWPCGICCETTGKSGSRPPPADVIDYAQQACYNPPVFSPPPHLTSRDGHEGPPA